MGASAWATVALEQGLPYFGVALTDMHYHESWTTSRGKQEVPKMFVFCVGE